jgi:hypothetical protein
MQFRESSVVVGNRALTSLLADSATVIEAGTFVTKAALTDLAIAADATSTAIAYTPFGKKTGETKVQVYIGDLEFIGTGSRAFAQVDNGNLVDLAIATGQQVIDLANSATKVLKVVNDISAGVVGSAKDIRVTIAKPL